MGIPRLGVVMTRPPLNHFDNQEGIELAMLTASFGQPVSLFFVDEGVWQLVSNLTPNLVTRKNFQKSLPAMEFYDIEHLYVCETSLAKRNIDITTLGVEIQLLSPSRITQLMSDHQQLLRF